MAYRYQLGKNSRLFSLQVHEPKPLRHGLAHVPLCPTGLMGHVIQGSSPDVLRTHLLLPEGEAAPPLRVVCTLRIE